MNSSVLLVNIMDSIALQNLIFYQNSILTISVLLIGCNLVYNGMFYYDIIFITSELCFSPDYYFFHKKDELL